MNYFITRDGQDYGPYSLGDLQRYVASGQILLTDMARSEGMTEPMLVSQIIGTIPVPMQAPQGFAAPAMPDYPDPPNLHWGLVLLFAILSCGIFSAVWNLVLAAWMKKVKPQSTAIYYYIAAAGMLVVVFFTSFALSLNHTKEPYSGLLNLVYGILSLIGRFSLRSSIEDHYNSEEPMGVSLSGVMTFFFGTTYIQYHLNDIVRRKNQARMGLYQP